MRHDPTRDLIRILQQFDTPGPRYTSYPTAPLFRSDYGPPRFEEDLQQTNAVSTSPLSLYLHIPFCDTLCYFCGCNTVITRNRAHITAYLSSIKKEIDHVAAFVDRSRPVVQMAWGGGTPSYLTPDEIRDLGEHLRDRFTFASDAEISIELDPRELTRAHLEAFAAIGANRFSLGVQDFDERVQRAVNRIQPESLTNQIFTWARELGIGSINADLIYGLPHQSVETFRKTLDKVVQLSPERIAAFNFAYVPWMKPHQKLIHEADLPAPEQKLELLLLTIDVLLRGGYEYIGMDHFARPEDELAQAQKAKRLHRNFQGYSTRAGADLYGFGMSAISHFGNVYAQNAKTLADYQGMVNAGLFPVVLGYRMTPDDRVRKHVIMRLMCDLELTKSSVRELFGVEFDGYFSESVTALRGFKELGLVEESAQQIVIREQGRYVLRNIAMCFDAHLKEMSKEKPLFSRTV